MGTTAEKLRQELREVDRKYLVFYLRVYHGLGSKILGHLVDISEKGIMLICDKEVAVETSYQLRMRLPMRMKEHNEIAFEAVSKWCKTDANPDFYLAGFQLQHLAGETRELIKTLIRDFGYVEKR